MKEILRNPDSFGKILDLTVSALSLEEIMIGIVDELKDIFGCGRCTLYVVDAKTNELYTEVVQSNAVGKFRIPVNKNSIAGFVALTGREVLVDDVYDEKKLRQIDADLKLLAAIDERDSVKTKEMMAVPLKVRGKIIGVLQAMNKSGGFLTRNLDAMREFSPILALAVNHALLMQKRDAEALPA